jgi:hypothetical protein
VPYATTSDLRALDGLGDATLYPDDLLSTSITYATQLIDSYCGASFEPRTFTAYCEPISRRTPADVGRLRVPVIGPRTVTSATNWDGTALDVAAWTVEPEYAEVATDVLLTHRVTLTGTASATATVPTDVAWAARTVARQWLLDLHSRTPDRALSVQNDYGQVQLAQAGGKNRPTSLPDVNAVLNRHRHRPPTFG